MVNQKYQNKANFANKPLQRKQQAIIYKSIYFRTTTEFLKLKSQQI